MGPLKLTVQTAERRAVAGASETTGSLLFRSRERPPTQLHQAPSRLQRCAPSRLSTISGAAEPKSLSRLNNGEMERTKIAPPSPGHSTFTRVRENHSSPEATPKPVFFQVLFSITKHAMRRSADEIGATSISFRPKVFSDATSVVDRIFSAHRVCTTRRQPRSRLLRACACSEGTMNAQRNQAQRSSQRNGASVVTEFDRGSRCVAEAACEVCQ